MLAARDLGLAEESLHGLKDLLGFPSTLLELDREDRRLERTAAFREVICRAAESQPLVLIFDHFESFDEVSKQLIRALVEAARGNLAIIVSHTAEERMSWPPMVRLLELTPPAGIEALAMARAVCGENATATILNQLGGSAGGQPLFVEQLALARHFEDIAGPPEKLPDLIALRIDRSSQRDREHLQALAVFNEPVGRRMLCELLGRDAAESELGSLVDRGFLQRTRRGLCFSHQLIGRVVYSAIPAEVRRLLHRNVAAIMRRSGSTEQAVIAFHAYQGDDGPNAISELECAAAWAASCLADDQATMCHTWALQLIRREWGRGRMSASALDEHAVDLAVRLATLLKQRGEYATAEGVLEEVLSVAAGSGESRARLRLVLGELDLARGNLQRAMRHLQLAAEDSRSSSRVDLIRGVNFCLARTMGLMGHTRQAGSTLVEGMKSIDQSDRYSWETLLSAAVVHAQVSLGERARGYLLDALRAAEAEQALVGRLRVVVALGEEHLRAHEWAEAEIRLEEGIRLCASAGARRLKAKLLVDLGRVHRIAGAVEEARGKLEEAAAVCRRLGWSAGIERAEQEVELLRLALPQPLG
jgi:tetratricopeptide (TPR) repeat protein